MEWSTLLTSALGSSPAALLSFYFAHQATKDRKDQEKQCRVELQEKDVIIASKDAQIASLQQARIEDLRAVMVTNAPMKGKPSGSGQPF